MNKYIEQFEVLDQYGNKTGKILTRGYDMAPGEYMGIVTIIVINKDKKFLVTKRHPNKKPGLMWEVTGGGILAYEDPLSAAVRELKEETGIIVDKDKLIPIRTIINDVFFCHQYVLALDEEVNLKLASDEVIDYKFLDYDDFFNFIQKDCFISYIGQRIIEVKDEITSIYNGKKE